MQRGGEKRHSFEYQLVQNSGVPMKTAYIHIGTEKTGSTSIQQLLGSNREKLNELGYHVPNIQHTENHLDFVAYCIDRFPNDQQRALLSLLNIEDPIQHLHRKEIFKSKAAKQLVQARQTKNVIITSEHFHSRIKSAKEVAQLRELLGPYYQRFKVVVYLRRQDQLALSLFNEAIKYGGTCKNPLLASHPPQSPYFDYLNLVEMWAHVFGKENISIKIFETEKLHEQSLIKDFLKEIDISEATNIAEPPKANSALTGYQQHLLLFFNEIVKKYGPTRQPYKELREKIIKTNGQDYMAAKFHISNAESQQFLSHFTEMNRILSENWLNGKSFRPLPDDRSATGAYGAITETKPPRDELEHSLTSEIIAYLDSKERSLPEKQQLTIADVKDAIMDLAIAFNADNCEIIRKRIVQMH